MVDTVTQEVEQVADSATEQTSQQQSQQQQEKRLTQNEVNRILAAQRRDYEQKLASRPAPETVEELQKQLAELRDAQEMAGKNESERAKALHMRELEKRDKQFQELQRELQKIQTEYKKAQDTVKQERVERVYRDALMAKGVLPSAASKALKALVAELRDVDESEGKYRASYGDDLVSEDPQKIAESFLRDNPFFASASFSGAGTRQPNGSALPKNLADLPADKLWELAGQFKP